MEPSFNSFKYNTFNSNGTVALNYLFSEGEEVQTYQIVRFAPGEPWLILNAGMLRAAIDKKNGFWFEIGKPRLPIRTLSGIGKFIDKQHLNFLPDKIKEHWLEMVEEVIVRNESEYMVVTKAGTDFRSFKNVFTSFIAHFIEEEWSVKFKVYNADFSDEFVVRVF